MTIQDIKKKWISFVRKMNSHGVPVPTIRDPKTGLGSISLTLLFMASTWVQLGLFNKFAHAFGDINLDQAMQFFYASSALYFGRKFTSKDSSSIAEDSGSDTKNDKIS